MENEFQYINKLYGLKIVLGVLVKYKGELGKITGVNGQHVMIELEGEKISKQYHPTWELEYIF